MAAPLGAEVERNNEAMLPSITVKTLQDAASLGGARQVDRDEIQEKERQKEETSAAKQNDF